MKPPAFEGHIKCHPSYCWSLLTPHQSLSEGSASKAEKLSGQPGSVFIAPLKTWQACLTQHLILCCGVLIWIPTSSREKCWGLCLSEARAAMDLGSRTNTIPRYWSAEPRSSPPKAASWRCLAIALKTLHVYPPSSQTWAFWVCNQTR